jgi:hypothetical protein
MYLDRSVRYLSALGNASTSRVLNLMAIANEHDAEEEYRARPLFQSPVMNTAILLKHRVRADESYLFLSPRSVATKVIVPFDLNDLRLGGRSFFFEQRGYQEAMQQIGNYREGTMDRDLDVLKLVNTIPSLDPFLLREHLRNHHYDVAGCYFAISQADKSRMYEYVSTNIRSLIRLAGLGGKESSTAKLVSALLSTEVDEKLAPLRVTLGLDGEAFREGVFSWRGFLYYKWCMQNLWPDLRDVVRELKVISPGGALTAEFATYITASRARVVENIRQTGVEISNTLRIYDDAYGRLVECGEPTAFRDFLLGAPAMFLSIGEKMGAISHIASFWRYRFPRGHSGRADAEELATIFQDFESGFGVQSGPMSNWAA